MSATSKKVTPYELLGGEPAVRQIVDRFYDLMDELPEARALRAMHAADLEPMRERLFEFMTGWFGGPNLYFQRPDAKCLGSAHHPFAIDVAMRDQWRLCMTRALDELGIEPQLRQLIDAALERVTEALRNR